MYKGTYDKIERNALLLRKLHAQGNIQNIELFDEPYKLALKVLDCKNLDEHLTAKELGLNKETVKQIRSALGVN